MSERSRVRAARASVLVASTLAVGGLVASAVGGHLAFWWRSYAGLETVVALAFAVFVWHVLPRQPRNGAVWAMVASIGLALNAAWLGVAALLVEGDPLDMLHGSWVPANAPRVVSWGLVVTRAASVPGLLVPLTLGVMLFPEGALPSRRWRAVAVTGIAGITALAVHQGWWYRPTNTSTAEGPVAVGSLAMCALVVVVSVAGLIARFRTTTGSTRLQHMWIVWGTGTAAPVLGVALVFLHDSDRADDLAILAATVAAGCWVVSYGIAVGRYRPYDVDVVVSKTVVLLCLAALVTGIYLVVVVGLGALAGGSSLWRSVLATAIVAMVFEPVRVRLQRWANRLVYGPRATPYEILADVTSRLALAETGDQLFGRLAAQLHARTGARRAVVWLEGEGSLHPVAVAPDDAIRPEPCVGAERLPGAALPIGHEGEVLGHVTLEPAPGMSLHPADLRLAGDLAAGASLVAHKERLDRALAAKAREIEESRRRLVRAQDDELRRLQRDFDHDVDRQIVALEADVGLARHVARGEDSPRALDLVSRASEEVQDAIDQIRAVAHGIHPAVLDSAGLDAAIPLLAARSALEVEVDVRLGHRHPPVHERAVYFCVSEALTNAAKHAVGPVTVTVRDAAAILAFSVRDSGPGFDVARTGRGAGLDNMVDRLDALGGHAVVDSRPGAPTTVAGSLSADAPATS